MRWFGWLFVLTITFVFVHLNCGSPAMGQGVTVDDILADFGPLLELPPLRPQATSGGTRSGPTGASATVGQPPPAGQSGGGTASAGSRPASTSGSPSGSAPVGATSGNSPIIYEGEMVAATKANIEDFHEQVTKELLHLVGLGFLELTSRKVDVNVTAGKMRMVVDGNTVSLDPVTLTIDLKWEYSTATGGKDSGRNRMTWAYRFDKTEFFVDSPFHDRLTLTATETNSTKPKQLRGVWSATPVSGNRYNVVLVLNPLAGNGIKPEDLVYSAFSDDPSKWEADRRQTATESNGLIKFPPFPNDGKPRWILRRVDDGGKTTSSAATGSVSPPSAPPIQGSQNATQGQPTADEFFDNDAENTDGGPDDDMRQGATAPSEVTKPNGPPTVEDFFSEDTDDSKAGGSLEGKAGELDILGQGSSGGTPLPDDGRVDEDLDILGQKPESSSSGGRSSQQKGKSP